MAIIVYQLETQFKLKDLLDTLPISTQTYFYWKRKFRDVDPDENLKSLIKKICKKDIHLGVRRVYFILRNQYNLQINHKKVQRIIRILGIKRQGYSKSKRKYNSYKGPTVRQIEIELIVVLILIAPLAKVGLGRYGVQIT